MRGPSLKFNFPFVLASLLVTLACAPVTHKTVLTGAALPAETLESTGDPLNSYAHFLFFQLKSFAKDDKGAAKNLEGALRVDPHSAYLWNQKAYQDLLQGNVVNAENDVQKALDQNPQDVPSLLLLGKIRAAQKNLKAAVVLYQKAIALDPKNEEAHNLLARDIFAQGHKKEAEAALENCVLELPESMSCLYYLATMKLDRGDDDGALVLFRMIAELNPDQVNILNTMGEVFLKKKEYAKAIEVFRQISAQNPDDLSAQLRVGLLYYQLQDKESAIQQFLQIHEVFPKSDKVNYFLGLLYLEKNNMDQAYHFFDLVPAQSDLFKDAVNRQVLILRERTHGTDEAVKFIEAKFKNKTDVYFQIKAAVLIFETQYVAALDVLNTGLKKFTSHERLLFQRAMVFDKLNRWGEARADLEKLIQLNPKIADAYNYLAYGLAERNLDLDKALIAAEKANELAPNEGHIMDTLAWVHFKMDDSAKALPLLQLAIQLEPNEPSILEHLGDVYHAMANRGQARVYYEKSLKILESMGSNAAAAEQKQVLEKKLGAL